MSKKHPSESDLHELDLSTKVQRGSSRRRMSQSFHFPPPKIAPHFMSSNLRRHNSAQQSSVPDLLQGVCRSTTDMLGSVSGLSNISSASQTSLSSKLKFKKTDQRIGVNRGPMKAVVPVRVMSKSLGRRFFNSMC